MQRSLAALVGVAVCLATPARAQKLVASNAGPSDGFGFSIVVQGDRAAVGAPLANHGAPDAGAVYVFDRVGGQWTETARLEPPDPRKSGRFGWSLALDGDRLAVGEPGAPGPGSPGGRATLYAFDGLDWVLQKTFEGDDGVDDGFGQALALEGHRLWVGAHRDDTAGVLAGAAYLYELTPGGWVREAVIWGPDAAGGDFFGYALDLEGDLLAVGAYSDDDGALNAGSVYTFERHGALGWLFEHKLHAPDPGHNDFFGRSLSLDQGRVLVGAPQHDGVELDAGSAYLFARPAGTWDLVCTLTAPDPGGGDAFGHAVALHGDRLLVGAPNDDDKGPNSGSVWSYELGGDWYPERKLLALDGSAHDYHGLSLALDDMAYVSSFLHDSPVLDAGACYGWEGDELDPAWVVPYCFCTDGPCGNGDPLRGCANQTGNGAALLALGGPQLGLDDLELRATGMPAFQFGVYLVGGGVQDLPAGAGRLCIGAGPGTTHRSGPLATGGAGSLALGPGLSVLASSAFPGMAPLQAGQTWYFQVWYRDPLGPCGSDTNLSNAVAVTFEP